MPKKVKKVWNIVTTLLLLVVVVLALLIAGVRLIGLQPFAVLSGSMEPAYPVGSLIYVRATDPEDVEVGDPITFVLNEDLVVATHRVIEIDAENMFFYTKGDNNDNADLAPVYFKNLVGVPQFCIPYLGYISSFVSAPPGLYVLIAGGAILLVLIFLPDLLDKMDESDKRAAEKKAAKAKEEEPVAK